MNYMKGSDDFLFNYTHENMELIIWIHGFWNKVFPEGEHTAWSYITFLIICRFRKPQSASRVLPLGPSKTAVSSSTMSGFLVARSNVAMHVFKRVRKADSTGNKKTFIFHVHLPWMQTCVM